MLSSIDVVFQFWIYIYCSMYFSSNKQFSSSSPSSSSYSWGIWYNYFSVYMMHDPVLIVLPIPRNIRSYLFY